MRDLAGCLNKKGLSVIGRLDLVRIMVLDISFWEKDINNSGFSRDD